MYSGSSGGHYSYRPERHYGIEATLRVFMVPGSSIGILSAADFLQRTRDFLDEAQMSHIINIWIGNDPVFRSTRGKENANTRTEEDNVEAAFGAALSFKGSPLTEDAGVWAHGFGESFETDFRFAFNHEHVQSSPSIVVRVLSLPIELSWRVGEELLEHMDRLNLFLDDKEAIRSENEEVKIRMDAYLGRLREMLSRTYDASEVRYEFRVDLGSIVW